MHRPSFLLAGITALLSLAACRSNVNGALPDPPRPEYVELTLPTAP